MQWILSDPSTVVKASEKLRSYFGVTEKKESYKLHEFFQGQYLNEQIEYNKHAFRTKKENIKRHRLIRGSEKIEIIVHRKPMISDEGSMIGLLCKVYEQLTHEDCQRLCSVDDDQFRTIVEEVNDLIAVTDHLGAFQYLSPQWEKLLGYDRRELIGRKRQEIMEHEDAQNMEKAFAPYFERRLPFSMLESEIITKTGRKLVLESSGTPIFDKQGHFQGYRVISRDISLRKRMVDRTKEINKQFEKMVTIKDKDLISKDISLKLIESYQQGVYKISRSIINSNYNDLCATIQSSLAIIGELSNVDRVYIFSFNDDQTKMSNTYEWCSQHTEPAKSDLQDMDVDIFPWWMAQLKKDKVINVYEVSKMSYKQKNEKSTLEMQNIKSVLVVPMYAQKELIGFLGFDSVVYHKRWNDEIPLLRMLAEVFAFTVKRQQQESQVQKTLNKMTALFEQTIEAFSSIVEFIDPYTAGHQQQVATLSRDIAHRMGLEEKTAHTVYLAGMLHDLGKIHVPATILNKTSKLTPAEFELVKAHPITGYEIINNIDFPWPIADIILQHHERLDGSGHPYGIKEDEILLESKILMVADVYDAVTSHRPYRPALGQDVAFDILYEGRGCCFDKEVVDTFIEMIQERNKQKN